MFLFYKEIIYNKLVIIYYSSHVRRKNMKNEFEKFKISDEILKAIEGLGYKKPSEVQDKVIPEILLNKDVVVKSQTGSGKSAAFAIPLCEKIDWNENSPQVLVLSPTSNGLPKKTSDIFLISFTWVSLTLSILTRTFISKSKSLRRATISKQLCS